MRYSLRRWIATVVLAGALFGLTFNLYSGGFTPNPNYVSNRRGDVPPGKTSWGDVNEWGWPFTTRDVFDSYIDDYYETTQLRRMELKPTGIALNLVFWFAIAFALTGWTSRFFRKAPDTENHPA